MASRFTRYDLEQLTDYEGFESLCNDVMSQEGYRGIHPLGGHKDKGRDAIHVDNSVGKTTIFSYSVREDWESKLEEDLEKVSRHGHHCDRFTFVTTGQVSPTQLDNKTTDVRQRFGWEFEVFDLDRLATLIDNHRPELISRHSNIFILASRADLLPHGRAFSVEQYAAYFLARYETWGKQYPPLLAEHRNMETFVDLRAPHRVARLPVASIPAQGRLSVVLGESGAGKTTSLWRIVEAACRQVLVGTESRVPVLFSLREWSSHRRCRDLFADQFSPTDVTPEVLDRELAKGSFLLLLDGLNEVQPGLRTDCCHDIATFASKYPDNRVVISCRSSDYPDSPLPVRDVFPPIADPDVYEICRLERDQITAYAKTYFAEHASSEGSFVAQLGIGDDEQWNSQTSLLQLARIPLFLQLCLEVFRETHQLPDSRVMLLAALVERVLARDQSRRHGSVDTLAIERVLGQLSFWCTSAGFPMRFPLSDAQEQIIRAVASLKPLGLVSPDTQFKHVWSQLMSANFMRVTDRHSGEWLHQLVRDYFLGLEYARKWTSENPHETKALVDRLHVPSWDMASAVALGALNEHQGAHFLSQIVKVDEEQAMTAFEAQTSERQTAVVRELFRDAVDGGYYELETLRRVCCGLPCPQVAITLDGLRSETDDASFQALCIELIGDIVVIHFPRHVSREMRGDSPYESTRSRARHQIRAAAMEVCERILRKNLKSSNEMVSFYAARGLWEHDRSAAVECLKKLSASRDERIRAKVRELSEEWGFS